MALSIRPATTQDAAALTDVINPIIAAGGMTAHLTPFDDERLVRQYIAPPRLVSCLVAHIGGVPSAFQTLVWPDDDGDPFPEGWAIIATFVGRDVAGRGIGQSLFAATVQAADSAGVANIDATVRSDNARGLRYYSRLGFRDYDRLPAVPLRDGSHVDRIRKRFDLPVPALAGG